MKSEILYPISDKLRLLREEKNLTQEDLATKINIKRTTYANYETARIEIPLEMLNTLANFYEVNIDYILNLAKRQKIIHHEKVNYEVLASNLRKYLKENNLKIKSFALDANTTISTIWAYLHNKECIRTTYLYLICKNNQLSADELLERGIPVHN